MSDASNDEDAITRKANFDLALPADVVARVLAAVRDGAGPRNPIPENLDQAVLAKDLGWATLLYRMRLADDSESGTQLKRLKELDKAVQSFRDLLHSYSGRGQPGWSFLRKIAGERHQNAWEEFGEIEARRKSLEGKLQDLRLRERDLLRSEALDERRLADLIRERELIQRSLTDLNQGRATLERKLITFDNHTADGILAHLHIELDLLADWLEEGFAKRDALMKEGQSDPLIAPLETEGYIRPLHWLVKIELRRIYEKHFGRPFGRSRNDAGPQQGRVDGPAVRFAVAASREMGVRNKDGNFLTPDSVEYYWRS
jgi:hypothetical protein